MAKQEEKVVDWLNLPPGVEVESLWHALHDAHVESIQSDLSLRTISFTFVMSHLAEREQFLGEFRFVLRFEGVQSVRVLHYSINSEGKIPPPDISWHQDEVLKSQYQAFWREESVSWREFESSITRKNGQVFDIVDAILTSRNRGTLAVRLKGYRNFADYHEIFLRSESVSLSRSDGQPFQLEALTKLGEAFWEDFASRQKKGAELK